MEQGAEVDSLTLFIGRWSVLLLSLFIVAHAHRVTTTRRGRRPSSSSLGGAQSPSHASSQCKGTKATGTSSMDSLIPGGCDEVPNETHSRFLEPDDRDWCGRNPQVPAAVEERSWEDTGENRESGGRSDSTQQQLNQFNHLEQLNSQFAGAQISSKQGGADPALAKVEVPWSARRGNLSEKDRVLKTVKGILNMLTPKKFDVLEGRLIVSGIATADILKGVVLLIYEKAVLEPMFCPLYARLCSDLRVRLPSFPSDEPGGKDITFRRVLLNKCQEEFEGADNLREELRQMTALGKSLSEDKKRLWSNFDSWETSDSLGSF